MKKIEILKCEIEKLFNWHTSFEHSCIKVMIRYIGDANEFYAKTNN